MTVFEGLEAQELTKRYGPKKALEEASFVAEKAGFTVLLGPTGAGKTTTLRLLSGLEPQTKGRIYLDGREVSGLAPKDRDLAMIFDNLALYPNKNGFENLASPLVQRKRPLSEIRQKVYSLAEKLNLTLVLDRLPKTMSGGEKQRLALGRALVREPRFFLLDEPLSSVDAPLRFKLRSELKRLQKQEARSFLMATPDFAEALAVGDKIITLNKGRVTQIATPKDLYARPVDLTTATFVGSPPINLFKGRFEGGALSFLGLRCPCPGPLAKILMASPRDFTVGLRPENAALILPPNEPRPEDIVGAAPLVDIEPLGRTLAVTLKLNGERLTTLASAAVLSRLTLGQEIKFKINEPESVLAFNSAGRNFLA
ncbi:MAG: ABC transporter ATP-binding protein [Deltaproteobacteria bacterium]|jgi:multiple sugar transport system ATP-binding protein|nr:ABC transporter ATP-binding protein [Deltaproteobacteria bacterium]